MGETDMGLAGQMLYSLIAVAVNLLLVGGALARWGAGWGPCKVVFRCDSISQQLPLSVGLRACLYILLLHPTQTSIHPIPFTNSTPQCSICLWRVIYEYLRRPLTFLPWLVLYGLAVPGSLVLAIIVPLTVIFRWWWWWQWRWRWQWRCWWRRRRCWWWRRPSPCNSVSSTQYTLIVQFILLFILIVKQVLFQRPRLWRQWHQWLCLVGQLYFCSFATFSYWIGDIGVRFLVFGGFWLKHRLLFVFNQTGLNTVCTSRLLPS